MRFDNNRMFANDEPAASRASRPERPVSFGEAVQFTVVFALMVVSAAALAIGMVERSAFVWIGGHVAWLASLLVAYFPSRYRHSTACHVTRYARRGSADGSPSRVSFVARRFTERHLERSFANAVARGDLAAAEAILRRRRPRASPRRTCVDCWTLVDRPWNAVVHELQSSDGLVRWCPTMRRGVTHPAVWILGGRLRRVHMRITQRRWYAEGLRVDAKVNHQWLHAELVVRPTPDQRATAVVIHLEADESHRGRRAIRIVSKEAALALDRWASAH
jgi:hypothetical protein